MSDNLFGKMGYFQDFIITQQGKEVVPLTFEGQPKLLKSVGILQTFTLSSHITKKPSQPLFKHRERRLLSMLCLSCSADSRLLVRPKNLLLSTKSYDPQQRSSAGIRRGGARQWWHVPAATPSSSNERACTGVMPLAAPLLRMELSWRRGSLRSSSAVPESQARPQQMVTLW